MDFNPYSRRLRADPYPAYREVQAQAPVAHNERLGFYALSRYDDVHAALGDWERFSSASGITLASFSGLKPMIILMDPPRQTELRKVLQRALSPRRVARLEPRLCRVARELIAPFAGRGHCELVCEFAAPYPTTVIAELLGIDRGDRERFKAWADAIMTSASPDADSLTRTYGEIFAYFERVIAERRRRPGEDLVSALVLAADEDGAGAIGEDELLGFCALLLIAGNETMTNFLGNAMLTLAHWPEARRELMTTPALLATGVEELLRFEPPVHELARTLTCDVELHGRRLPEGSRVLLLLAAANRDPAHFAEPDRLDLRRDPNPHLSFGFGIHFCLGASLARLEARVALEELLAALPGYRLASEELRWFRTPAVRGPAELPLVWEG
ncbi:MAG: cytochrome P450 [Myxococcota bacterium]